MSNNSPMQEFKEELKKDLDIFPELSHYIGRINHLFLEKEKEVIIEAYHEGDLNGNGTDEISEQYYNQTFKK